MALTQKKKDFIHFWFLCFNATKAAEDAGYSKHTAYSQGSRLLKDVEVKKELDKIYAERAKAHSSDLNFVKNKLHAVVEADWFEFVTLGKVGATKEEIEKIPVEIRKMVTQIERIETHHRDGGIDYKYKFKLMDKTKCLELLGKMDGGFIDRKDLSGNVGLSFTDLVEDVT